MPKLTTKNVLILLFMASVGLTLSAFFIEYVLGAKPCQMCWWQRYAHWGVGILAVLGLALKAYKLSLSGIILTALTGLYVAGWQVLAQQGILSLPESCTGSDSPLATGANLLTALAQPQHMPACDEINFTIFNLSLAVWNIPVMVAILGLAIYGIRR